MIARSLVFYLLLILLADVYFDRHLFRRRRRREYVRERVMQRRPWWLRLLWWLPCVGMLAYTVYLALQPGFLPDNLDVLNIYLFLFGLIVIPKLLYAFFAGLGGIYCKRFKKHRNYGKWLGWVAVLITWYILFYGSFVGFQKLEVRRVELAFSDLPAAFDGYKIVQFSDAHVGTYTGSRQAILQRAVDSINAQHADLVVFTGDLQNSKPEDLKPHVQLLRSISAKDGVKAVLGNHDYTDYVDADEAQKAYNQMLTEELIGQMNWDLLKNGHRIVRRASDSLVIAGMENDGEGRFPAFGNIQRSLQRVSHDAFIVMLEHDPSSWRRKILPQSHCQLTLSGHTHAMQFSVFGWSPVVFVYPEGEGLYREGNRALFVSKGLGGVIPFRFGATGEIVVITLRKKT